MPTIFADVKQRVNAAASADFLPLFRVLLSYRTPMKMQEAILYRSSTGYDLYYKCPRCQITLEREFVSFCDRCGQNLDWRGYREVKITYWGSQSLSPESPPAKH